jgi:lactate permease
MPGLKSEHRLSEIFWAWMPYLLLVVFVLAWSVDAIKNLLNAANVIIPWPGLHNLVLQTPPVVLKPAPYAAIYRFRYLAEAGTSCFFATLATALVLRVSPARYLRVVGSALAQLVWSFISITSVLALAFVMNYSGATATLGLAFAATGVAFPFFSALLGWLGVFLTGSDTSSNALFGSLQEVTAHRLGLSATLMAAANSAGGVMGKMISLQSIAVAAAAAGMKAEDEPKLFRFTFRHSLFLAATVGLLSLLYAYAR